MSVWKWDKTKTDFKTLKTSFKDITGNRYGRLIAEYPIRIKKKTYWVCKCDCGNTAQITMTKLTRGATKSCGCLRKETVIAKNKASWKGYGDIIGNYFSQIKYNAKIRNLEFNITIEYIWSLFILQNGLCKLSGQKLFFGSKAYQNNTASLDRIDSSRGYIEGNVQWLHKDVNKMKFDKSDEKFIELCKLIAEYNK